MYRLDKLAAAAAVAPPLEGPAGPAAAAADTVDAACNLFGRDAHAMDAFVKMISDKDVRKATIEPRPPAPTAEAMQDDPVAAAAAALVAAFDESLKSLKKFDIVEVMSPDPHNVRWFGLIIKTKIDGMFIRWFEAVNILDENSDNFLLKLDRLQPNCNSIKFENIIGIVKF